MDKKTLLDTAMEFVMEKHKNQYRKAKKLPYVEHLFEVAFILLTNGASEKVQIAGLLHDVLEDTKTTAEELEKLFGKEITEIVLCESENKSLTWKERKMDRIEHIKSANIETKMVKCADLLSNISATYNDLKSKGENAWKIFRAPKEEQKWYYKSMIENLSELENFSMYKELKRKYLQTFCSPLYFNQNNTEFLDKILTTNENKIKFLKIMQKLFLDGKSYFDYIYKENNKYIINGMDSYDYFINIEIDDFGFESEFKSEINQENELRLQKFLTRIFGEKYACKLSGQKNPQKEMA